MKSQVKWTKKNAHVFVSETGLPTPNQMKTNDRRYNFSTTKQDLFVGVDREWEESSRVTENL